MAYNPIRFLRKFLVCIGLISTIILSQGQPEASLPKELVEFKDSSIQDAQAQNRNAIANTDLPKPLGHHEEYKRMVHFFILGFSFLMAFTFLIKAIIYNWDRTYIFCFLMFFVTILSLLMWEKLVTWTPVAASKFNPGFVGLWLNQLIPVFLILLYREFLELKSTNSSLYKVLTGLAGILFLFNCGIFIPAYQNSFIAAIPFIMLFEWFLFLTILSLCVLFFGYFRDKIRRYAFWSSLAVAISFGSYLLLNTLGIKTVFYDWFENSYFIFIGLLADGILFLTALSLKEKDISEKKNMLEIEKQKLLSDQNVKLELKVIARTKELEESLDHLKATQSQLIEAEKVAATLRIKHTISNDLHDEVGSTLTSIQLLSSLSLKNNPLDITSAQDLLLKIKQQTTLVQTKIRDIIWASQSEKIGLETLNAKISEIAANLLEPMNLELEMKELLSTNVTLTLSSEKCKNILMILREALHNIVKHSNAKKVTVGWEQNQDHITLSVVDDGNGKINHHTSGSGLRIMKERVENMGGQLQINGSNKGSYLAISFVTDSFTVE